jgi:ribosomal protein S27AE
MLLLHGKYHLARKVVEYRNDYCLGCASPQLALRHRTFDLLHIFFIPVLPLGAWKRWHCRRCGRDPHANPNTRRSFKWAGTALLGLMALVMWTIPISEIPADSQAMTWAMRVALPIGFVAALRATLKSKPDPNLAAHLARVVPLTDAVCPLCSVMLAPRERGWSCPKCGILRSALAGV